MSLSHLLDLTLSVLYIDDRSFSALLAAGFLLIQISLLTLLLTFITARRLGRFFVRRDNENRKLYYLKLLDEISLEDDFSMQYKIFLKLDRKMTSQSERGFLRRLILQEIHRVHGRRKTSLHALYSSLGFYREDTKSLKSIWWWSRLGAVMRLEKLKWPQSLGLLEPMVNDKHELVALGAMRALSAFSFSPLENKKRNIKLLDALSRRAPTRKDIFLEILLAIGREDPDALIQYLSECYDPLHASFAVLAIGRLKLESALPALYELSKSSSDEVAESVAVSLGMMGTQHSEATTKTLEALVQHPTATVRAQALLSLVPLTPSKRLTPANISLQSLQEDTSVEVQRALFEIEALMKRVS